MKEFLDYTPEQEELEQQSQRSQGLPPIKEPDPAEIGIIRELNPKKILDDIKMEMSGYAWDPQLKKYVKVDGMKPLMNEIGIAKFLNILSSFVSQLVTFSNFTQERVDRLVNLIVEETYFNVGINWREFGIPSKSDIATVQLKILMTAIASLSRAVGAGDRNVVRGAVTESIMNRQLPNQYSQEPQSLMSKLNPFGGKKSNAAI